MLEEYLSNKTKRRAVEREIEIIGEAMNKLLKINPEIAISYSRIIVDLRNKVIHSYDSVDDILIWKIIMKDFPILLEEVKHLLNEN
ncbi:HepT-like ribonuclease domain-containing protein [Flavobacterium sp. SUN052]|uniref:HepT-like ribonuclease domain-containing protein n=1 Tax=Flavobacterium sp. SUN052 TaxID=3002441 RepID=UPI00237EBC34|nr:HepT-like ribonuclease domain-containing protein [Flavobacterium sp. SUN052]MEC4003090.1 HepT-like ribonuclease domain-containing protein [Flavobacterium sp. SUN052]